MAAARRRRGPHRSGAVTLEAHVVAAPSALGGFTVDADLRVADGEVLAVVGPNGAGKTTLLRALAGLLPLRAGRIAAGSPLTVLDDPAADILVPVERRGAGVVFQDHRLFPHLSVVANVAYPARIAGAPRAQARAEALHWLGRLGLEALADRRPGQLSGGQAQRVALARALARRPRMLLLDEPTASLDASGAMTLRTQLREHLQAFVGVSIVVTHTALDAMVMADRLVVLDQGVIVQMGTPAEVAARPRTQHVAALVGLNLVRGEASDGTIPLSESETIAAADPLTGPSFAAFSPASVSLYGEQP